MSKSAMATQIDYSYSTSKALSGAKADIRFDEVVMRRNEEVDGILELERMRFSNG